MTNSPPPAQASGGLLVLGLIKCPRQHRGGCEEKTTCWNPVCPAVRLSWRGGWWWFALKPVEDAKKSVLLVLKGSDSVAFRDVDYYFKTGFTCGQVTAKKSLGGDPIFVTFVVSETGKVTLEPSGYLTAGSTLEQTAYQQDALDFIDLLQEGCPD